MPRGVTWGSCEVYFLTCACLNIAIGMVSRGLQAHISFLAEARASDLPWCLRRGLQHARKPVVLGLRIPFFPGWLCQGFSLSEFRMNCGGFSVASCHHQAQVVCFDAVPGVIRHGNCSLAKAFPGLCARGFTLDHVRVYITCNPVHFTSSEFRMKRGVFRFQVALIQVQVVHLEAMPGGFGHCSCSLAEVIGF